MTHSHRGFTLLIALIFMSVMLSFGLALGVLGYKQQTLVSGAVEAQYAFYAADAGLECALYEDQQQGLFAYTSNMAATAPVMTCDGAAAVSASVASHTLSRWVVSERLSLDGGAHCADVMVSKPDPSLSQPTYLYAQGYSIPCATLGAAGSDRFASRGLSAHY